MVVFTHCDIRKNLSLSPGAGFPSGCRGYLLRRQWSFCQLSNLQDRAPWPDGAGPPCKKRRRLFTIETRIFSWKVTCDYCLQLQNPLCFYFTIFNPPLLVKLAETLILGLNFPFIHRSMTFYDFATYNPPFKTYFNPPYCQIC